MTWGGCTTASFGKLCKYVWRREKIFYKTLTPKSHTTQRMKEPSFLSDSRSGVKSTHTAQRKKKSLLQHATNNHTGEFWAEEKTNCTCGVSATVATPRNSGRGNDFPACMYMPLHACTCMYMHVHACTCMRMHTASYIMHSADLRLEQ